MSASNLVRALLLLLPMLFSGAAQAMQFQPFDKMAAQDQSRYIGDLIVGAEKVLTDEGRPDLADQVKQLFTTKKPGDADVIGMVEFERNLAILRENDAKNAISHPEDPRLEVEDVMFSTLRKNHIELPDGFFTVTSGFKPQFPMKP